MASSEEFVQYVVGQLDEAGCIIYKKLFGEYGLWYEGKFFGTVEDNQFYVKKTKAGAKLLPGAEPVAPTGERRACMRWRNWMIKHFWQNLSGQPVQSFRLRNPESQKLKRRNRRGRSVKRMFLKDKKGGLYGKNRL